MEILSIAVNAGVVAAGGLILAWIAKGRFDMLERRIEVIERRLGATQASIDALRSDLTQVALAVGAGPRAGNA